MFCLRTCVCFSLLPRVGFLFDWARFAVKRVRQGSPMIQFTFPDLHVKLTLFCFLSQMDPFLCTFRCAGILPTEHRLPTGDIILPIVIPPSHAKLDNCELQLQFSSYSYEPLICDHGTYFNTVCETQRASHQFHTEPTKILYFLPDCCVFSLNQNASTSLRVCEYGQCSGRAKPGLPSNSCHRSDVVLVLWQSWFELDRI